MAEENTDPKFNFDAENAIFQYEKDRAKLILEAKSINPGLFPFLKNRTQIQTETCEFITHSKYPLFYRKWSGLSTSIPKRILLCLHGLHSHGGKFIILADKVIDLSWTVIALDLRGHGLSWAKSEDRGDIADFSLWINDVKEFITYVKKEFPNVPIHLVAESMGGAIAVHFASILPQIINSLVLISPAIKAWPVTEIAMIQAAFSRALVGRPEHKSITNNAKGRFSTNSHQLTEYQKSDPLRLNKVSPRYYYQAIKMIHNLKNLDFSHFCPTMVFYGENDHVIDFAGIKEFILRIQSRDKLLAYIPAAYHEMLTDEAAENYGLFEKIILWTQYFK